MQDSHAMLTAMASTRLKDTSTPKKLLPASVAMSVPCDSCGKPPLSASSKGAWQTVAQKAILLPFESQPTSEKELREFGSARCLREA